MHSGLVYILIISHTYKYIGCSGIFNALPFNQVNMIVSKSCNWHQFCTLYKIKYPINFGPLLQKWTTMCRSASGQYPQG